MTTAVFQFCCWPEGFWNSSVVRPSLTVHLPLTLTWHATGPIILDPWMTSLKQPSTLLHVALDGSLLLGLMGRWI